MRVPSFLLCLVGSLATSGDRDEEIANPDALNEAAAWSYMKDYNADASKTCNRNTLVGWAYATDLTEANRQAVLTESLVSAHYWKETWKNVTSFEWRKFRTPELKRLFKSLSILGTAALPDYKFTRLGELQTQMEEIYNKATICDHKNKSRCDLTLEPDLKRKMTSACDADELQWIWEQWREATGKKMRGMYREFIDLSSEAAKVNDFTDMGAIWRWVYESDTFEEEVAELWETVRPLYEQLHAYVRRKLREKYGEDKVTADGPIPAHLLGDMWAQDWSNLKDLLQPYKMEASLDITPALREQNYTAERLFRLSEEFFTSIGLSPMPETFWNLSIIEKPKDRTIICHASAWDFCDSKDFRIKQCTDMTMEDFVTVHHEMGHVEYFIQYKDLHIAFRDGANPGFHEAVGDVIALSVMTPKHMVKIGLLSESAGKRNWQVDLNYLMSQALSSVAFLPYGYLIDVWRWNVFRGNISSSHYNCEWWKLRSELQGIQPPNIRSEEDFDPGAKYHIAANVPYIRYFVSNIIQFQFHRALCTAAGEYDPKNPGENPIHQCDIYQSKEAGNLLKAMLRLGSSRPWGEAMAAITGGNPKMDASALREYFQPLEDWLTEDNKKHGAFVGWKPDGVRCVMEEPDQMGWGRQEENASGAIHGRVRGLVLASSLAFLVSRVTN